VPDVGHAPSSVGTQTSVGSITVNTKPGRSSAISSLPLAVLWLPTRWRSASTSVPPKVVLTRPTPLSAITNRT